MYKIPESLTADILYNESLIKKFERGEINGSQLKSNRVPMGIYEQRQDGHYMLRIRCTGGLITPLQLRRVAEVGEKIHCSHIHITTRQEVQLHNVSLDNVTSALLLLKEVGLSTQGGGGNTIRNMLVNDLGGIVADEVFDPYPYAIALTTRLIAEKDSFSMPRKLKIAFDLNESSANFSLVNDFGLIPVIKNGEKGFKAYLGGSVATNPHRGWEVFEFLPVKDLFRALKAAKNFFNLNGNRKNRHKARIRYIFYRNGEQATKELYYREYNKIGKESIFDLEPALLNFECKIPTFLPITDKSSSYNIWLKRYVKKQKQAGLYYMEIPFLHGNNSPEVFMRIADFLKEFGDDVIRFTPRQNMQIRNIPEAYLANIYHFFKDLGFTLDLPVLVNNLTSCTGADTCRLGICLPKGAVDAIRRKLIKTDLNLDEISTLKINLNGCTNSCAQSAWTDLGFSGRIGRVDDHPYPAYTVWARVKGRNELAEAQGYIAARNIPSFVEDYLRIYLDKKDIYQSYDEFVQSEGSDIIKRLLAEYKDVPLFNEDKNYYYDWGAEDVFSLSSHGQAECSAGLFDIIEIDQAIIEEKKKELQKPGADENRILHDIVFSASRMLLITRGADPRTDEEVYDNFERLFIHEHLVNPVFKGIVEKARHKNSLVDDKKDVLALADAIKELYATMDDSLQFKIDNMKISEKPVGNELVEVGLKKDFRGVACPMNFVKTKIALSSMQINQVLEILLDDGQPINNVPGSVRNEGHEILSTTQIDGYWRVLIRKKHS